MKQEKQFEFEKILLSGNLIDLKIYQVNKSFFKIPSPEHWLIDGGIEFVFPDGVLTFGWSTHLNMFVFDSKKFEKIFKNKEFNLLSKNEIYNLNNLRGKSVREIEWKWIQIETWNSKNLKFIEEPTVLELNIEFNTNEKLQIAPIDYELTNSDKPIKYRSLLDSDLLISLNHKFMI
ncbi:hypothetical protein [Ulvibacter litoralis]|uniref:Uncharacterized protein n=1 Tax=Ulvibacter litoralis TaxID=227084 RepID=A0A1G7JUC5_9FLAO|nr:hypothetical protein [Ulvibacter litoralis]SDF28508.1 hypothetical protein SAMN05421855_1302 [Ulvibacter litoralis]